MKPKTFLRAWTRRNHPEQLENLKYWKEPKREYYRSSGDQD